MASHLTRSSLSMPARNLRVEIRFKNAHLFNAMLERTAEIHQEAHHNTMQRTNGPVAAFCLQHGLNKFEQGQIYKLLNLRIGPKMPRRAYVRPFCVKLAALLDQPVEWLFPNDLYDQPWPMLTKDVDGMMMSSLREAPTQALMLPPAQEDTILQKELSTAVGEVLDTLTPREQRVLRLRFGFKDDGEQTYEEIGDVLGVTRERVRQIEARAFRKMRHHSRSQRLQPFIDSTLPDDDSSPLQATPEVIRHAVVHPSPESTATQHTTADDADEPTPTARDARSSSASCVLRDRYLALAHDVVARGLQMDAHDINTFNDLMARIVRIDTYIANVRFACGIVWP